MEFKEDFINYLRTYGRLPVGSMRLQCELMNELKDIKEKVQELTVQNTD